VGSDLHDGSERAVQVGDRIKPNSWTDANLTWVSDVYVKAACVMGRFMTP
jgi:hypothetical protein